MTCVGCASLIGIFSEDSDFVTA